VHVRFQEEAIGEWVIKRNIDGQDRPEVKLRADTILKSASKIKVGLKAIAYYSFNKRTLTYKLYYQTCVLIGLYEVDIRLKNVIRFLYY